MREVFHNVCGVFLPIVRRRSTGFLSDDDIVTRISRIVHLFWWHSSTSLFPQRLLKTFQRVIPCAVEQGARMIYSLGLLLTGAVCWTEPVPRRTLTTALPS